MKVDESNGCEWAVFFKQISSKIIQTIWLLKQYEPLKMKSSNKSIDYFISYVKANHLEEHLLYIYKLERK